MGGQKVLEFTELEKDVFRCREKWFYIINVPVCVFLIKDTTAENGWFLIDAGVKNRSKKLIKAIQHHIGSTGEILNILLTHGHYDHIGAISGLLDLFPNAKVKCHTEEAPFLLGKKTYKSIKGDHTTWKCLKSLTKGTNLVLSDVKLETVEDGYTLNNQLQVFHLPGHTLGSIGWYHIPSGSLMVGDVIMNMKPSLSKTPRISLPLLISTPYLKIEKQSLLILRDIPFQKCYPCHDDGDGITKDEVLAWIDKNINLAMKNKSHDHDE